MATGAPTSVVAARETSSSTNKMDVILLTRRIGLLSGKAKMADLLIMGLKTNRVNDHPEVNDQNVVKDQSDQEDVIGRIMRPMGVLQGTRTIVKDVGKHVLLERQQQVQMALQQVPMEITLKQSRLAAVPIQRTRELTRLQNT
jgi:hypothetical protein